MAPPRISAIVPTYNEEKVISQTLLALRQRLGDLGPEFEILVVDNGSQDGTLREVEPFLEDRRVRVLSNDVNQGKGFSVRRGMLEAGGEARLLCDADCELSLESLPAMLAALEEVDLVCGSRVAPGARVDRHQPVRRRIFGWPYLNFTRLVLREPTYDLFCGFKLWRAPAAEAVFARQRVNGWAFDAESTALARRMGFRVREVGIRWRHRQDSRLGLLSTIGPALVELFQARRNVRREMPGRATAVRRDQDVAAARPRG